VYSSPPSFFSRCLFGLFFLLLSSYTTGTCPVYYVRYSYDNNYQSPLSAPKRTFDVRC
jgi:hypothetical protein